ncbi:MAG: hypothetical protein QM713_03255 [Arachnia sp.]
MGFLRSTLAFLLLLAAAALGVGGAVAQWADMAARTPSPARQIVAPIATDAGVRAALAETLTERAAREIPEIAEAVKGLPARLETLIGAAVDTALADPEIDRAWLAAIDATRLAMVDDIEHHDGTTPPTLWFDLTPFVDLAKARLIAAADDRVRPFLEDISWTAEPRAALLRLDPDQAELAADALRWAGRWPWLYGAALAAAVVGLVVGPRRGRWGALLVVGLLTAGGVAAAGWAVGLVEVPNGSSLGTTLAGALVHGSLAHLAAWLRPVPAVALAAAAVGAIGLVAARPR